MMDSLYGVHFVVIFVFHVCFQQYFQIGSLLFWGVAVFHDFGGAGTFVSMFSNVQMWLQIHARPSRSWTIDTAAMVSIADARFRDEFLG